MCDVRRADLESDREADFGGDGSRTGGIRGCVNWNERDAIGCEYGAGLLRVEPGFPPGESGQDDVPRRREIGLEHTPPSRRGFHQQLLAAPM